MRGRLSPFVEAIFSALEAGVIEMTVPDKPNSRLQNIFAEREIKMSTIDKPERVTQNRVIAHFRHELGYRYLGDWTDRGG